MNIKARIANLLRQIQTRSFSAKSTRKQEQANFLYVEQLEPRMMLNGSTGNLVFSAGFEDAELEPGQFAFFREISGFTSTDRQVEVQNNHPSVGAAAEGAHHLELDGVSGVYVEIEGVAAESFLLNVAYSARPGVSGAQNNIEVYWNGNLVETLSADGERLHTTRFEQFEIELPGMSGRLEFRSNSPNDSIGLGGLIDDIRVFENQAPLELQEIDDQDLSLGSELDLSASLLPPNENLEGVRYSLDNAPAGMTIDPQTGQITWTATQANIDNSPSQPDQTIVGDPVLKFESGFEDVDVERGGFGFFDATSGFTATGRSVEVQDNHPSVGAASQGSQHLELDGVNGIHRDVETTDGNRYELVFDYSPRPQVEADLNAIEVWWGGQLIETVVRDGSRNRSTDFQEVRLELTGASGSAMRLEFRSNSPDDRIGLGGLLDNVRLYERDIEIIQGEQGKYEIDVIVTDSLGRTDSESFTICVDLDGTNRPPILNEVENQTLEELQPLSVMLVATDPDGDDAALVYDIVSGPESANIDASSGELTWTPTEAQGPGTYTFQVRVTDSSGLSDLQEFTVEVTEVNVDPVLANIADQAVIEGDTLTLNVSATDSDDPENTLVYSILEGPDGVLIGSFSGEFNWRPGADAAGESFDVTVQVEDGNGGTDSQTFSIFVEPLPDRAPVMQPVSDQSVDEGDELEVFLTATDEDTPLEDLRFQILSGPDGASVDAVTGRLTWTPTEAQGPGQYEIEVQVVDTSSLSDRETIRVEVFEVNQAPRIEAIEDQVLAVEESLQLSVVAIDADEPANTLTYSIVSGPSGATIDALTGQINWTPTIEQTPGVYDFEVAVADGQGGSDTETFQVRVGTLNSSPVLDAIEDQIVDENTTLTLVARATDADVPPQTLRYSLSVAPENATIDDVSGEIRWTPEESDGPGVYEFSVVATDSLGAQDVETFQVTVNEVNTAPVLDPITDQTVTQEELLSFTAMANDIDLPPNTLTFGLSGNVPAGLSIDPSRGVVSWTPTLETLPGDYQINVTVSDGAGGSDSTPVNITVNEAVTGILLTEGSDFESIYQESLVVGGDTKELVVEFMDSFDTLDQESINDAFEIALLDDAGNSLVHTIDRNRDSFFNVTEGQTADFGVNTVLLGHSVRLDLSHLSEGTAANLVFRLVNNDADTLSQVRITKIETTDSQLDTPLAIAFEDSPSADVSNLDLNALTDVTGSLQVDFQRTSFNSEDAVLFTDIQVTSLVSQPIDGPFVLVVHSLTSPNVAVVDADGVTAEGDRFYLLESSADENSIRLGDDPLEKTLRFFNPEREQFVFDFTILAQPNTAPEFVSDPNSEGEAGVAYQYEAEATDRDNDELTYQLMAGPSGLSVDSETGLVNWTPETEDIGTHSVIVEVADGRGGKDMQQYNIEIVDDRPNRPPVIISTPVVETYLADTELGPTGNLVVNGDFESGDSGFFTEYAPIGIGAGARAYSITTNPNLNFSAASSYGDATTGSGNMLAVNGSTTAGDIVWEQTIDVTRQTTYDFAANLSSWFPAAPAELVFTVNGEAIGELVAPTETGVWELVFATWESGDATEATIQITNGNIQFGGNDFALDDIYFGGPRFSNPSYQYQVETIDPDFDPVTYELDEAPSGMEIDGSTGLVTWNPTADQIGTHSVSVTASDGRGGTATQTYDLRVLADPTNTAPVIVSTPVDDFFVPGFSNPASGEVSPQRIALDLGNGETFEGTVSITLPGTADRFADIVLVVDESASMGGDQEWVAEMIPLLDEALIAEGIGATAGNPNRFAVVGYGGGRENIVVGHFLNQERRTKYTLYGPDGEVVAEGTLNDVVPDELLNLNLPDDGRYALVIESQNATDLEDGINIGINGQVGESERIESLELNRLIDDRTTLPGQIVKYRFTLDQAKLIHFDSQAKDDEIGWTLRDRSRDVDVRSGAFLTTGTVDWLEAGNYEIVIDSNTDLLRDFQFQILDLTTVPTLQSDQPQTGTFDELDETLAFQFDVGPNQVIEFFNEFSASNPTSNWEIYDRQGRRVQFGRYNVNLAQTALEPGQYYLLLNSAFNPSEGVAQVRNRSDYEIQISIFDAPAPTLFSTGESIEGEFDFVGQMLEFEFEIEEHGIYYFDSLADNEHRWSLSGPSGDVEINRRFDFSDSFDGLAIFELAPGTYRVTLQAVDSADLAYGFRILSFNDATTIVPGTAFDDQLNVPNETKLYQFNATAGEEFFIDIVSASDTDNLMYRLFDDGGVEIIEQRSLDDRGPLELTRDETYTLAIEGWIANTEVDTFTINVIPVEESRFEIQSGVEVNSSLTVPASRKIYTFELSERGLLLFDSTTNRFDLNATLRGPRGEEFTRRFDRLDNQTQSVFEVPAGSYEVVVFGNGETTGDFAFTMLNLLEDSSSTAITPNPGEANPSVAITGSNVGPIQSEVFRFDAAAGDEFSFDGSGVGITSVYSVVDQYGKVIVPRTFVSGDRNNITFVESGTYYLLVEERVSDATVDDYSITINWIQNNGPRTIQGEVLDFGSTKSNTLTANSTDFYQFELAEETLFYLDALTNSSSIRWTLTGPQGSVVSNRAFSATDSFGNASPVSHLFAGQYQLEIRNTSGSDTDYQFRVQNLQNGTAIQPGTEFNGSLTIPNQTDIYRFAGSRDQVVFLDVVSASDAGNTLYAIVDPFGQVVYRRGGLSDSPNLTLPADGDYYLLIEGWIANTGLDTYSLNVQPLIVESFDLTLGQPNTGLLATSREVHQYQFELTESQLVTFDTLTNDSRVTWSLEGPRGNIIDGRRIDLSDSFNIDEAALNLEAGEYTLSIQASAIADYQFALLDISGAALTATNQDVTSQMDLMQDVQPVWTEGALTGSGTNGAIDLTRPIDSLDLPEAVINGVADYTIEFWYRTEKTGLQALLSGATEADDNAFLVSLTNDTTFAVEGVGTWSIDSVADNQWHHYALVNDSGNGTTLFVDGISQGILGGTLAPDLTDGKLIIGQEQDALNRGLDTRQAASGQLDELRFWHTVRTEAEIVANKDATIDADSADLAAYYRFDETSGTIAADQTSNGLNATYEPRTPSSASKAFTFEFETGDLVLFDGISDLDIDPYWRLVNANGKEFFNESINRDFGPVVVEGGTYHLIVEGRISNTATDGQFTFNVSVIENTLNLEPPAALDFDEVISGTIDQRFATERYQFELTETKLIHFDVIGDTTGDNSQITWSLIQDGFLTNDSVRLTQTDSIGLQDSVFRLGPGLYTLELTSSQIGDFSFALLDLSTAPQLAIGQTVSESADSQESKLYRFDAVEGQNLYLNFTNVTGASNAVVRIYDETGSPLLSNNSITDQQFDISETGSFWLAVEGRLQRGAFAFDLQLLETTADRT